MGATPDPLAAFRPAEPAGLVASGLGLTIEGRRILEGVDLEVAPGQVVGVLGPNGSGKSTLLRCIIGHHRGHHGTVRVDGLPRSRLSARELARKIAMVVQEQGEVLGLSVGDVVELGALPRGGDVEPGTVAAALAIVGLGGWEERRFDTLSGGEKQRVMLTRALVQRAPLLILDEPTNHLDVKHQFAALELVRRLGVSAIITLHDLELAARYCDHLLVLASGRVVARGPPEAVLTASLIAKVYAVEAELAPDPRSGSLAVRLFPLKAA